MTATEEPGRTAADVIQQPVGTPDRPPNPGGLLRQFSSVAIGFPSLGRDVSREELAAQGVSQQAADARMVQQNMEQAFLRHFSSSIRCFGFLFLLVLLVQSALMLELVISFMFQTCSGPVRTWAAGLFLITVFNGMLNSGQGCQSLVRRVCCCFMQDDDESRPVPLRVRAFDLLTRFVLPLAYNAAGVYLTLGDAKAERPCQATAPGLFAAARAYAVFTIACSALALVSLVGMATVLRCAIRHGLLKTSRGASPQAINNCKVVALSDVFLQEHPACSICLEEFCSARPIVSTACGHHFHKQCLTNWLQVDTTCPLCRGDLDSCAVFVATAGDSIC